MFAAKGMEPVDMLIDDSMATISRMDEGKRSLSGGRIYHGGKGDSFDHETGGKDVCQDR